MNRAVYQCHQAVEERRSKERDFAPILGRGKLARQAFVGALAYKTAVVRNAKGTEKAPEIYGEATLIKLGAYSFMRVEGKVKAIAQLYS